MAAKKMNKQFFNLDGKKPPGYTHVVVSPPGRMIFISGTGGSLPDGSMPADFSSQVDRLGAAVNRNCVIAVRGPQADGN